MIRLVTFISLAIVPMQAFAHPVSNHLIEFLHTLVESEHLVGTGVLASVAILLSLAFFAKKMASNKNS